MGLSSTGIGSGLDVEAIIASLMSVEQKPLVLLQEAEKTLDSKISTFGTLKSYLSDFSEAARKLKSVSLWQETSAASSDESAVSVSSSKAAAGRYSVEVQELATAQTVYGPTFEDADTELNEGSLTIQLGNWASGSFVAGDSDPVAITIGAGETSLADIRDKINSAEAGVSATIVTDAAGARLVLTSDETGEEQGFSLTATETADDGDAATGLSSLNFTSITGSPMTRSQEGANAVLTVNGIAIDSASNTLTGIAEGLTITLKEPTTSAVTLTTQQDTSAVEAEIQNFVNAFNTLAGYIKDQTKYTASTGTSAILQGDRTAVGMQNSMRNILNEEFTGSTVFATLSDIGITMNKDGKLETSSSDLTDALTDNLADVRKLFADSTDDNATTGFMQRYYNFAQAALSIDGSIQTRTDTLEAQLETNEDQQDAMEQRLEQTEKRLRAQYEALDTAMASLSSTSNYVSMLIASL